MRREEKQYQIFPLCCPRKYCSISEVRRAQSRYRVEMLSNTLLTLLCSTHSFLVLFFLKFCNPFTQFLLKQGFVGKTECILLCIICLIRSIVPQELVYIKTYPFVMIKLILQIYRIYPNPHTGFYW